MDTSISNQTKKFTEMKHIFHSTPYAHLDVLLCECLDVMLFVLYYILWCVKLIVSFIQSRTKRTTQTEPPEQSDIESIHSSQLEPIESIWVGWAAPTCNNPTNSPCIEVKGKKTSSVNKRRGFMHEVHFYNLTLCDSQLTHGLI